MKRRLQKKQLRKFEEQIDNRKAIVFDKFLYKNGEWIALTLISTLLLVIFRKFILGQYYYLFSDSAMDSLIAYYPGLMQAAAYIRSNGFPLWSFSQGMGQSITAKSLSDPFYFICYIAGPAHLAGAIIWMEIIKIIITAFVFFHFLKLWNITPLTTIVGTMLYCFSGFMIVGGEWFIFSTGACYLALLLLGFEKMYRDDNWHIFPIAVALIAIHNPFDLYMSTLFLTAYLLFRHFLSEDASSKKLFIVSGKMIGYGILGIIMSSFILVANCQLIMDSPRVSGNYSLFSKLSSFPIFSLDSKEYYSTALMRFFSSDLAGNGKTFTGWRNYLEAPLFYIGLLPLILAPQILFFSQTKKRLIFALFLLIFIIPVILPYFRYAAFLFTGDYFRIFSLFVALSFLFPSLYALDQITKDNRLNLYALCGTVAVLIALLYFPVHSNALSTHNASIPLLQNPIQTVQMNTALRTIIAMFILSYLLLFVCHHYSNNKFILQTLLVILISLEIGVMCNETLGNRSFVTPGDMNDYAKDSIEYIKNIDKGFYRVNKIFNSGPIDMNPYNDSQVLGYFGTMSYDSFNQKYYIRFLEELDLIEEGIEAQGRYLVGISNCPLLWSFASIKYHLSLEHDNLASLLGYAPIAKIGNVIVNRNTHVLPLGFTYKYYIPLEDFRKLPQGKKPFVFLKALVAEEPVDKALKESLTEIAPNDLQNEFDSNTYSKDMTMLAQETLNITSFSQNNIQGTIDLRTPKVLFLSIPYDKAWNAYVDGQKVKPLLCNLGFMGIPMKPGVHKVKMIYMPGYFLISLFASILGIFIYIFLLLFEKFQFIRSGTTSAGTPSNSL